MSWENITIDQVGLTPQEKAAFAAIQGATERGAELLALVVNELHECCQAGNYAVGDPGTVPAIARLHVLNRTRWLWLVDFPQLRSLQTKERSALNDAAEKFFTAVSQRDQNIPGPDGATSASGNWNSQNKILGRMHPTPRPASQSQSPNTTGYANPDGPTDETEDQS
jgi:hypothetical protein